MEIKDLKKIAMNLDNFTAREVDELEFMDTEELDGYQHEIERDTGNISNWDDIRAVLTFKHKILEFEEKLNNKLDLLMNMDLRDEAETYTTGYRNGHTNGQIELIQWLLNISDEKVEQER